MSFQLTEKSFTRLYEFGTIGRPRAEAARAAMEQVEAAMTLQLPVQLESVTWKAFRNGGNVHKATCYGFRVTVGELLNEGET